MYPNIAPPPNIDRLLALLERYLTPKGSGLPGGTATQTDVDSAQKGSPDKGGAGQAWNLADLRGDFLLLLAAPQELSNDEHSRRPRLRRWYFFGVPLVFYFLESELVSWLRLSFDSSPGSCGRLDLAQETTHCSEKHNTTHTLHMAYATRQPPPQAMAYRLLCNIDNSASNFQNLAILESLPLP
ncbi:hypothetical protein QSH57_009923 [Fusarium oxysporum f. sp. vasinfectum]|nr:hypothetical protein QSH57_009923 [Fusarium oxysporum f. sp. vasinfectum]